MHRVPWLRNLACRSVYRWTALTRNTVKLFQAACIHAKRVCTKLCVEFTATQHLVAKVFEKSQVSENSTNLLRDYHSYDDPVRWSHRGTGVSNSHSPILFLTNRLVPLTTSLRLFPSLTQRTERSRLFHVGTRLLSRPTKVSMYFRNCCVDLDMYFLTSATSNFLA